MVARRGMTKVVFEDFVVDWIVVNCTIDYVRKLADCTTAKGM